MRKSKKILACILAFALTIAMTGMGTAEAAKKKPKLSKTKVTLYVGKTATLKVKNTKKKVKWSSSKKSVATVSQKGKIKAKKKGKLFRFSLHIRIFMVTFALTIRHAPIV